MIGLVAEGIKQYPFLNSTYTEKGIQLFEEINIGVAMGKEEGLIVPVIHNSQSLDLVAIAKQRLQLVEKARSNTLVMDDLSRGTFTITNLGMYGIDVFTPILNYPQAGILSVGRIRKAPKIKQDQIVIGQSMVLGITVDHRIIDGLQAAKFLQSLSEMLQNPEKYLS